MILEEDITFSVLSPPYSDNGQSNCHSDIDIEVKDYSLTENMKSEDGPSSSMNLQAENSDLKMTVNKIGKDIEQFVKRMEELEERFEKKFDGFNNMYKNINLQISKMKSEIVNKNNAAVKDYESDTENISEELWQNISTPSLLSPIKSSDEDVNNSPSKYIYYQHHHKPQLI